MNDPVGLPKDMQRDYEKYMATQNKLDDHMSEKMSTYLSKDATNLKNVIRNIKCNEVIPVFRATENSIGTKIQTLCLQNMMRSMSEMHEDNKQFKRKLKPKNFEDFFDYSDDETNEYYQLSDNQKVKPKERHRRLKKFVMEMM